MNHSGENPSPLGEDFGFAILQYAELSKDLTVLCHTTCYKCIFPHLVDFKFYNDAIETTS